MERRSISSMSSSKGGGYGCSLRFRFRFRFLLPPPKTTTAAMPQGDHIELHQKRHGRRLDHEERKRKREVHKRSQDARKLLGAKGKRFANKRYAEKAQMKKTKREKQRKEKGPALGPRLGLVQWRKRSTRRIPVQQQQKTQRFAI
ncbi:ribosome biogenesis protein NSA2-like [Miscanthus floridulus]|uniref:ribosome biogenesis protein NSA2-like n=1 Tax=Miscanthus floridulus TaxID=154761 RepID=UPI003459D594